MFKGYIPIWKKAIFLRFLVPATSGILLQWYLHFHLEWLWRALGFSVLFLCVFFYVSGFRRYKLAFLEGITITIIFISLGSLTAWYRDVRHSRTWFGNYYEPGLQVKAVLLEPAVEKANSFRALASISVLQKGPSLIATTGKIIIYFTKNVTLHVPEAGAQIIFSKELNEIKNTGNPGSFDYKRYCLFHDITSQVYLVPGDFVVLKKKKISFLASFVFLIRARVVSVLETYIPGKQEKGLAEAMLIGYKDNLDKDLEQSYIDTGVVHIIVIAGLHLGMIYYLLSFLAAPLRRRKTTKWLYPVVVITGVWLFSLATGAHATVIRSAVMLTCLILSQGLRRRTSAFNTLALSAFLLLCYDPFWLWDAGFQLSYAAVLSIVVYAKPIYRSFYIKNKLLDFVWKLSTVSLAAQLLTAPLSLYHFHQFPNFFLLTNFVAVPLASICLFGEIFLCFVSCIKFPSIVLGHILSFAMSFMNEHIEQVRQLPFSVWHSLQISSWQAGLLLLATGGFSFWIMEKQKKGLWMGLFAIMCFSFLRSLSFYKALHQQRIIVYNTPQRQAIDFVSGRTCYFTGDTIFKGGSLARNVTLEPARVLYRVQPAKNLAVNVAKFVSFTFRSQKIALVKQHYFFDTSGKKIHLDFLIISAGAGISFINLAKKFDIRQIIFDASVSTKKIQAWKNICDSLHIPNYNVTDSGAFVMNLN